MPRTFYDILDVGSTATPADIRAAYDRLVHSFNMGGTAPCGSTAIASERERIEAAFVALRDPASRARYDLALASAPGAPAAGGMTAGTARNKSALLGLGLLVGVGLAAITSMHSETDRHGDAAEYVPPRVKTILMAQEGEAKAAEERATADVHGTALERVREFERKRAQNEENWRAQFDANLKDHLERQRLHEAAERLTKETAAQEPPVSDRSDETTRQREDALAYAEARRRVAREREELCRIERERYGRSLSC